MILYHGTYSDNFLQIIKEEKIKTNNTLKKEEFTSILDKLIKEHNNGVDIRANCIYLTDNYISSCFFD